MAKITGIMNMKDTVINIISMIIVLTNFLVDFFMTTPH